MAHDLAIGITNSITDPTPNVTTTFPPINIADDDALVALNLEDFQVANGAADQAIQLNGLTCRYVLIQSDVVISIKVNGSANDAQVGKLFLLGGASVTALHISNASGQTATLDIRCFT